MKLYSNHITVSDLFRCLPPSVSMEFTRINHPRNRKYGYTITLFGHGPQHTRRKNSGQYGADHLYAATYDDHGYWMARLFQIDPEATISNWRDKRHFEEGTNGKYTAELLGIHVLSGDGA